jgi:hypothetical protein
METHRGSTAAPAAPFSEAELQTLHGTDKEAARNIVCLMTGVFTLGLIGYLIIAFIVAG